MPVVDRISEAGKGEECRNRQRVCRHGDRAAQPNTSDIVAAIERLITGSRAGGVPEIEFYDDVPIDELPSELQAVVFPILLELLVNACRHSKSKSVLVGLAQDDARVSIQVQDWGVGFDPEIVHLHERGLKAIRQLVQWRGGTINVDSRPGAGTFVVIEIPLLQETKPSNQAGERRSK